MKKTTVICKTFAIIKVFEQIHSLITLSHSIKKWYFWKTMVLWGKKLWYYTENYLTLINYGKTTKLWNILWYNCSLYLTIVKYSLLLFILLGLSRFNLSRRRIGSWGPIWQTMNSCCRKTVDILPIFESCVAVKWNKSYVVF